MLYHLPANISIYNNVRINLKEGFLKCETEREMSKLFCSQVNSILNIICLSKPKFGWKQFMVCL